MAHRVDHYPSALSGGEQQRVAIARALINGGEVVLADEPTGSVDSDSGKEIMSQIEALAERGHTIILITHDASVAAYAHRRIELLDGRVICDSRTHTESSSRLPEPYAPTLATETERQFPVLSLQESLHTAVRALRANMLRTALTLLGIVIGVAFVSVILGLAEGVEESIAEEFNRLGGASLTVTPMLGQQGSRTGPSLADANAIRDQIPNLQSVSPEMHGGGTFTVAGNTRYTRIVALSNVK